jgi:hypothetical protein
VSLLYKVPLAVDNIPTHIWSVESIQAIIGTSFLVFEVGPSSLDGTDLSRYSRWMAPTSRATLWSHGPSI